MAVGGTGSKQGRIYAKSFGAKYGTGYDLEDEIDKRYKAGARGAEGFVAKQASPALRFQKKGEKVRFRAWVSGQAPKPFVYYSFLQTSVYAKGQLQSAVRSMFSQ